jgi:hypothetical protein
MQPISSLTGVVASAIATAVVALASTSVHAQNKIVFKSLADMDKCAAQFRYDTGYCMEPLESYAAKNPKELFEIGKRARLHFVHRGALRFFEPALDARKKPSAAQCADEDVALAVISGFSTPPDSDDNKRARKIFTGACFEGLRPSIEKEITSSGASSYTAQNACAALAAKGVKSESCAPKPAPAVAAAPEPPPAKLPSLDKSKASIGLIRVYAGPEGERLTMADVKDSPGTFLVRLDGVRSPMNGKTFVHLEEVSGRTMRYWTEHEGKRWTTVLVQNAGSGFKDFIVFVPGTRDEVRVSFSETATQAAKPESLR